MPPASRKRFADGTNGIFAKIGHFDAKNSDVYQRRLRKKQPPTLPVQCLVRKRQAAP
jgi:hypothetical protein